MSQKGNLKRKRTVLSFKSAWLDETVETESTEFAGMERLKLGAIYSFNADFGVVCLICRDANDDGHFATGMIWVTEWKLDFLKRHLSSKKHLSCIQKIRHKNPALRPHGGLISMLVETRSVISFIRILCDRLADRFPENEVGEWSAFDCLTIVQCQFEFGISQINSLCTKFQDLLVEHTNVENIINQYNDFKFAVAEKIKSKLIFNLSDMVEFALNCEQFKDLAELIDIGATFMASSADCERGFSLMNMLKNKRRNRLEENHLDMLMRIKSYILGGGEVDFDRVYSEWVNSKERREKL